MWTPTGSCMNCGRPAAAWTHVRPSRNILRNLWKLKAKSHVSELPLMSMQGIGMRYQGNSEEVESKGKRKRILRRPPGRCHRPRETLGSPSWRVRSCSMQSVHKYKLAMISFALQLLHKVYTNIIADIVLQQGIQSVQGENIKQ